MGYYTKPGEPVPPGEMIHSQEISNAKRMQEVSGDNKEVSASQPPQGQTLTAEDYTANYSSKLPF